ncbi:hypothetical protein BSYN_16390 [Bacteroides sedimenti]|uniref:Uncharacterized protein n=2 Tax=Bacteroides sedimenti TaxID=2136147 RepID=A0ABM8IH55_9BACE
MQRKVWGMVCGLLLILLPLSGFAQYVKIRFDVHDKITLDYMVPFEFSLIPLSGTQKLVGACVLNITGVEKMQVLVTLSSSDSLRNMQGSEIPFGVKLAYRNDGKSQPPEIDSGREASFALSEGDRIADNSISRKPNAYIFIRGSTDLLQNENSAYIHNIKEKKQNSATRNYKGNTPPEDERTTYVGDIYLKVEYN